jgi:hypothetical protein
MTKRKAGRPRTDWQRLNLKLLPEVIKNMRAIAMSEGFVIKQGDRMGEPSISAWLNSIYKPKE